MEDYEISNEFIHDLVSVIIPTHNRADIICETIDSIFAQTYAKIELIVVDDHSTDETEEIIKRKQVESKLYDFRYIKSHRKGGCAARNIGVAHCKGEYIQFFDDDDIMFQNHIEKKITAIVGYDFVACNFTYFEGLINNVVGEKRIDNINHTIESHLLNSAFPAPSFLCNRKVIQSIGFWNEKSLRFQDMCYFHRLFLHDLRGVWISSFLFTVRTHSNCISKVYSSNYIDSCMSVFEFIRKEWSDLGTEKKSLERIITLSELVLCIQFLQRGYIICFLKSVARTICEYPVQVAVCLKYLCYKYYNRLKGTQVDIASYFNI